MNKTRIRLVTRGDDAGSCHSANKAILESCQDGVLLNASIMVPGPAFNEVVAMFAGLSHVSLGLHVTLNAEWDSPKWGPIVPAVQVPSLVDEQGHFYRTPKILDEHGADVDEMIAEVQAQCDLARQHGLPISYIDEHMGVGWVSSLRERLDELAQREGLVTAHQLRHLPMVKTNNNDLVQRVIDSLEMAPPDDYVLVTHPGYDAADMQALCHEGLEPGQVARERDNDRLLWLDSRLQEYCRNNGVEFARYTDVLSI